MARFELEAPIGKKNKKDEQLIKPKITPTLPNASKPDEAKMNVPDWQEFGFESPQAFLDFTSQQEAGVTRDEAVKLMQDRPKTTVEPTTTTVEPVSTGPSIDELQTQLIQAQRDRRIDALRAALETRRVSAAEEKMLWLEQDKRNS
jgi:hypothetical protein